MVAAFPRLATKSICPHPIKLNVQGFFFVRQQCTALFPQTSYLHFKKSTTTYRKHQGRVRFRGKDIFLYFSLHSRWLSYPLSWVALICGDLQCRGKILKKPWRSVSSLSEGVIREQHSRKKCHFKWLPSVIDICIHFPFLFGVCSVLLLTFTFQAWKTLWSTRPS